MSLPGVIANLSQYQGTDAIFEDTIYGPDGVTPQDITGWAIQFVIHAYGDPSTVFVTKTTGAGVVLTDPTNGKLQATVLMADIAAMFQNQYGFFIKRTDSGAEVVPTAGLYTLLTA